MWRRVECLLAQRDKENSLTRKLELKKLKWLLAYGIEDPTYGLSECEL